MFGKPPCLFCLRSGYLQLSVVCHLPGIVLALAVAVLLHVPGWATAAPKAGEFVVVVVQEGQTIRDLAGQYLRDTNLWEEILRVNQIDDVTSIVPGAQLKIPVALIDGATQQLDAARGEIQHATQVGAKVFARDEMGDALEFYNTAVLHRKARAWEQVAPTAVQARTKAREASAETMAKREAKAEAILSDRQGTVHGRKPQDNIWKETLPNGIVIEQEKIRTLSQSQAELTFRDESRLRLNENSQAIIRSMRVDLLKQKQETKVSLVSGDIYALLKGRSAKKKFDVEVKGVKLKNASRHFRAIRDAKETKLANYDTGRMQVTAAGETVTLGKNQGTIVRDQQKPTAATALPTQPELIEPKDNETIFQYNATLAWRPVTNAASYWLELALDPRFQRSILGHWRIVKETLFAIDHLEMGVYYWRVAAMDSDGLPGPMSQVSRFTLQSDVDAPYLVITSPQEGHVVRPNSIRVQGATEPGVSLTLHAHPVRVDPQGKFEFDYKLQKGVNTLAFAAQDKAGHVTRRIRTLLHLPDQDAVIRYDSLPQLEAKHFLTRGDTLSLSGTTAEKWEVQVQSESGRTQASTFADESGRFRLNVPVHHQNMTLQLLAISPSGFVTEDTFRIARDQDPPTITVDELPPSVTRTAELRLQGEVQDAIGMTLSGRVITVAEGRFDEVIRLMPGKNRIELTAVDRVGNEAVTSWVVVHDVNPPELVSHQLSRSPASHGKEVIIEVAARDASGLKQAAPYWLQVGPTVQSGFLKLNKLKQSYHALATVPFRANGSVRLKSVELEDYAGNSKTYVFK